MQERARKTKTDLSTLKWASTSTKKGSSSICRCKLNLRSLILKGNQKMNSYLHIIERQIGFKKSLHSHLARHTYCTLLLNKGIRLEVVSKAAGHKSTKITQRFYAHLHNETIVNEVAAAFTNG